MVIGDKVITAGGGYKNIDEFEVRNENVTNELVVRPRQELPKMALETRRSLNNRTKQEICELSVERYGQELNFRTEKKLLISQFLEIQDLYR